MSFTFIDLFAGIGGMRLGFEAAGGHCVYTSEIDKFSAQTYAANFLCAHPIVGDITKIDAETIPDHDVLVAGFPCQSFSKGGYATKLRLNQPHGFADLTKGTLFFDVARILAAKRPQAFLLENVKNLVLHDKGETFKVIKRVLEELGYQLQYRVIEGGSFVPQHRERVMIVGFREFTAFTLNALVAGLPSKEGHTLASILHRVDGTEPQLTHDGDRFFSHSEQRVLAKYTHSDKLWAWLQGHIAKHQARGNRFNVGLVTPASRSRTLSARYSKDGSEILVVQEGKNPRKLTPRECARLQGFPDSFKIPVSNIQAYKQFGNSVVVPLIECLAKGITPFLTGEDTASTAV